MVLIALACRGLCGRETADTAELGKINFVISYGHGGNVYGSQIIPRPFESLALWCPWEMA